MLRTVGESVQPGRGAGSSPTRRAGANFPDLCLDLRQQTSGMRHSSLLALEKSAPGATAPVG